MLIIIVSAGHTNKSNSTTEVTTDHNDRPVAVSGNYAVSCANISQ